MHLRYYARQIAADGSLLFAPPYPLDSGNASLMVAALLSDMAPSGRILLDVFRVSDVFPNRAARMGITTLDAADLGNTYHQVDEDTYWTLTAASPVTYAALVLTPPPYPIAPGAAGGGTGGGTGGSTGGSTGGGGSIPTARPSVAMARGTTQRVNFWLVGPSSQARYMVGGGAGGVMGAIPGGILYNSAFPDTTPFSTLFATVSAPTLDSVQGATLTPPATASAGTYSVIVQTAGSEYAIDLTLT